MSRLITEDNFFWKHKKCILIWTPIFIINLSDLNRVARLCIFPWLNLIPSEIENYEMECSKNLDVLVRLTLYYWKKPQLSLLSVFFCDSNLIKLLMETC